MINISIISKHEHDRKVMAAVLAKQNDFRITSIGEDGYDALKSAKSQHPDIIIMDFIMQDIESPDLAPIIKRDSPTTALIALGSHDKQDTVAKALKAGISGYLLRQDGFDNLASSVRSVFYGGVYVSESVKTHVLNYISTPAELLPAEPAISRYSFTPTELCIFSGIGCGHTDREIAEELNMCTGSLRNCVNHVKKKTGLRNRTQITIYALLSGIINIQKIKATLRG
jgi:DNA-binding NarL/FixJ family response regulator